MKNYLVYLYHMRDAAVDLRALRHEIGKESTIKRAMERNFEIMGEAAKRVPREMQPSWPEIPWKDVIDMRNIVAHEYEKLTLQRLAVAIDEDVPKILQAIEKILAQHGE